MDDPIFRRDREQMVRDQLERRQIRDKSVLEAMRAIPRHRFVPEEQQHLAYIDAPLPIGSGQTISQPYIVALMTELLQLEADDTVLEIGTGSGYQSAILSALVKQVYSVERIESLAQRARVVFEELGIKNVHVITGDGTEGLQQHGPYDGIIVTAAAPEVPKPLEAQLAQDGRLVLPVGSRVGQVLEVWHRSQDELICEKMAPVAFVPLIGKHGWPEKGDASRWWRR